MVMEIMNDALIFKIMGGTVIILGGGFITLFVYYWSEYKTNQKDTNKGIGSKIDQVTNSLNMFIEETVSLKKDMGEIKQNVALIHRDVISLEHRVNKHGEQIDNLFDRKKLL